MSAAPPVFTIDLPDEAATAALGADVAAALAPGDVVALHGDLGAGKTTLARAVVRALAGDPALEVPSPTFTLLQSYTTPTLAVAHFDLYRLADASELEEIGFNDALVEGAVLIEWPERAGDGLPARRLDIHLEPAGNGRSARVAGDSASLARFERSRAARAFLDATDWSAATRQPIAGDASRRRYERVVAGGRNAVLMDWPPGGQLAADDPRRLYRARDLGAFLAVDGALRDAGLTTPRVFASETRAGFALLEDFGEARIAVGETPVPERFAVAVDALAVLHNAPRGTRLTIPGGGTHDLPALAGPALMAELGGFLDSYIPFVTGRPPAEADRAAFLAIWRDLAARLGEAEQSWVLFDVQTPNLFWLPERSGVARVGFIDFQDMFWGPSAYDVASLCFDARVTVPPDLEVDLRERYVAARQPVGGTFDRDGFESAYAVCGALRSLKNLGAFARFAGTGNAAYLRHIPRVQGYLRRLLDRPFLSRLAEWYDTRLTP